MKRLAEIQATLNCPKSQFNKFGKYSYRNCEDILEAVKPLLDGAILTINDDIVMIGDRVYVKAVATITLDGESVSTTAFAREPTTKKGMDESQITGAASSYARKYALNGLLLADDTKDADSEKPVVKAEFKLDNMAKQWIEAAKADHSILEQIEATEYRNFIAAEVLK